MSEKDNLSSAEAVKWYEEEARRCEIRAQIADSKAEALELRNMAARFRSMKSIVSELAGLDANGNKRTAIETAAFHGNMKKRFISIDQEGEEDET